MQKCPKNVKKFEVPELAIYRVPTGYAPIPGEEMYDIIQHYHGLETEMEAKETSEIKEAEAIAKDPRALLEDTQAVLVASEAAVQQMDQPVVESSYMTQICVGTGLAGVGVLVWIASLAVQNS